MMPRSWVEARCRALKHESVGRSAILRQLKSLARARPWAKDHEDGQRAITYFENRSLAVQMDFPARAARNEPIGSGAMEAACKINFKQWLCGSKMRWRESGLAAMLSLRRLSYMAVPWDQFWAKIDQWGVSVAA
jgi:hypothetical protein